jgi:predicted acetyltransferase
MNNIKRIPLEDIEALYKLRRDTYPSFAHFMNETHEEAIEKLRKIQTTEPSSFFYGYYVDGELRGAMRMFDFTMNLYGKKVRVGGVGSISVDLLHKKEKIAKRLIEYFIQYYRDKGANFVFLYAFRQDFYKKMGFGYGTRTYEYQVCPSSFPRGNSKKHLLFAGRKEVDSLHACSQRVMEKNHGMIKRERQDFEGYLDDSNKSIIVYKEEDLILGYIVFSPERVERENLLVSNLVINEWVYESPLVLQEFMTFLQSQADQFERVKFETEDKDFFYVLRDPRNHTNRISLSLFHESHVVGVGMMVRTIDPHKAIEDMQSRRFGMDQIGVQFTVMDDFLGKTSEVNVSFRQGHCVFSDEQPEVKVIIDVSEYSSLLLGSVSFEKLYQYGLISVSDDTYVERLINLFGETKSPFCTVVF